VKKKTFQTVVFILALLFLTVAGAHFVNEGNSNPLPYPTVEITIENPQNITYNVRTFSLFFSVQQTNIDSMLSFYYNLNGQELKPIDNVTTIKEEIYPYPVYPKILIKTLRGSCLLFNLSEGQYSLAVHAFEQSLKDGDSEVAHSADFNFRIDLAPSISILSLGNKTYNTSSIGLDFTVNELASQIVYSLDGKKNVTITGNTTLNGLVNGEHTLTVYAKDEAGNMGASETITFTVAEPFSILFVATVSVSAIVLMGTGLLLYFKKRKR
jgi:hypothetical protein